MERKKLIEVAIPLDAIPSGKEKSVRHGHPSTLHLWWARRPLAAARAVIFAQIVDDPASLADLFPTKEAQTQERCARALLPALYRVRAQKLAAEALAYNGLVQSWPEISRLATMETGPEQAELFADGGTEGRR